MTPELTPHRYPCARCDKMRKLAGPDQLCWTPEPDDPRKDDSCWRAAKRVRHADRAQDVLQKIKKKGAA